MSLAEESLVLKQPPPWRRWVRRLIKIVFVLILVLICRLVFRHFDVTNKLDKVLSELDQADPGWRLEELEAAREPIPDEENSAPVIVAAASHLPKNWPPNELHTRLTHLPPQEQLSAEDIAELEAELNKLSPALAEARKLAHLPHGRHRIDYQPLVLETLLKDQSESRRVVALLVEDAILQAQKRDLSAALLSSKGVFNTGRSLGDEPLAVSQLIRTAGIVQACQCLERTLAQGEPPARLLAECSDLFDSEDAYADYLITARGERACDHATFDALEKGVAYTGQLADRRKPSWDERLLGQVYRDNFRAEHPLMLVLMNRFVAIAKMPSHEQGEEERLLQEDARSLPKDAVLTRLLLPGVTRLGEASRRKHADLRCLKIALAAERYRQEKKTWPESVQELFPKYLDPVPQDPFDGFPMRYHRLADGVVIYSIGSDSVDNGGNLDREHMTQPGVDIGFRLWDVAKRRQPSRPGPQAEFPLFPDKPG